MIERGNIPFKPANKANLLQTNISQCTTGCTSIGPTGPPSPNKAGVHAALSNGPDPGIKFPSASNCAPKVAQIRASRVSPSRFGSTSRWNVLKSPIKDGLVNNPPGEPAPMPQSTPLVPQGLKGLSALTCGNS